MEGAGKDKVGEMREEIEGGKKRPGYKVEEEVEEEVKERRNEEMMKWEEIKCGLCVRQLRNLHWKIHKGQ